MVQSLELGLLFYCGHFLKPDSSCHLPAEAFSVIGEVGGWLGGCGDRLGQGLLPEYATADEADAKAREILQSQPQATVRTAQLLNTYSAKVSVSVKAIPDTPADDAVPAE